METRKNLLGKVMALLLIGSLILSGLVMPIAEKEVLAKSNPGAIALSRQAAAEGIVVLENKDNVLPLRAGSPVSVFGRCQYDTFSGGYGTGQGPKTDYPPITIMQGFDNNPALSYNEGLAEVYKDWVSKNPIQTGGWGTWPANYPEMPVSEELAADAAKVSDTAIVVIGRAAGEDRELTYDEIKLTADETTMLTNVNKYFKKVIVLINAGNVIDMSWRSKFENIKSVVYVWQGGLENGNAIADVLSGDLSPSGKLADTIATSFDYYPSSIAGFGVLDGDAWNEVYREDIYVGYRYFETFHPEQVLYPFGFGLSYTDFEITSAVSFKNGNVEVKATVKNVGDTYSGKEVVQVYYGAPQGVLGKPAKELAGYAKTNEIAPGASQTLTVTFPISNMSSYDDAGLTGHKSAWVMEAGDYKIYVGNSVRDAKLTETYTVDKTVVTEQLSEANSIIYNQLQDTSALSKINAPYGGLTRLVPWDNGDGSYTADWKGDLPYYDNMEEAGYIDRVIEAIKAAGENAVEITGDKGIKLIDVYNGDATMDEFIAQIPVEDLVVLTRGYGPQSCSLCDAGGNGGGFGGLNESLEALGIPAVSTRGTPAGVGVSGSHTKIPIATQLACTWNDPLVQELYYCVGLEGVEYYLDVHLAPSMNIHRNPLGGRNFEYYSEDPVLAGQMAASAVIGAQKTGMSACPKHFALNSQEARRRYTDAVVSERAQREVYLKAFEICVKTSDPDTIMASYNLINGIDTCYNFDLATTILRNQWGWDGVLMTDWWLNRATSKELGVAYDAWRIRAQVDLNMPGIMPGFVGRESELKNDWENYGDYMGDALILAHYENWVAAGSPTDSIVPASTTITVDPNQPHSVNVGGLSLGEIQRSAKTVLNYILDSRTFRVHNNLPLDCQEATGWQLFEVEGRLPETKPMLLDLTINGLPDFNAFHPLTNTYKIFTRTFDDLPTVKAIGASGDVVTVKQATSDDPTALITVNNESAKNVYRIIFTNEAGLVPVVKNPTYAYASDILINGVSIPAFWQTVYSYDVIGSAESAEVTATAPSGVDVTVTKNIEKNCITVRTESDHQAQEYVIRFISATVNYPKSDNFNDGSLNTEIWSVLNSVNPSKLTESGGTLNIVTDIGEWYQNAANITRNVVYQTAEGDFEAVVTLKVPAGLNGGGANQFGLVVFDDTNNYADIRYQTTAKGKYDNLSNHYIAFVKETESVPTIALRDPVIKNEGWNTDSYTGELSIDFKVIKKGTTYTFGYRTAKMKSEGADFTEVGSYVGEFKEPKIGLFATKVDSSSPASTVSFDNFTISANTGKLTADDFEGDTALKPFWNVYNQNDEKLKLSGGAVSLTPTSGEWYESNETLHGDIQNVIYQNAKGDWVATVDMIIPGGLASTHSQMGLYAFDNRDNYITVMYQSSPNITANYGGHVLVSRTENSGAVTPYTRLTVPKDEGWGEKDQKVSFRIIKSGNTYSTYYLTEAMRAAGKHYALDKTYTADFSAPKVGFFACTGSLAEAVDYTVKVTDFRVEHLTGGIQSDYFEGSEVSAAWGINNVDATKYSVSDGYLNITTAKGDWYGGYNHQTPATNQFYQDASGDKWTATLTYTIMNPSLIASKNTTGLMLVAYEDNFNYIDVGVMTNRSTAVNPMYVNSRRKTSMNANPAQTRPLGDANVLKNEGWFTSTEPQTISVRIAKDGNVYKTYYQTETMKESGKDFTLLRTDTITTFSSPKIGFYMVCGSNDEISAGTATPSNVKIDSFVVTDQEIKEDILLPETFNTVEISTEGATTINAASDCWYLSGDLSTKTDGTTDYVTDTQSGEYALYQIDVKESGSYNIAPIVAAVNESSGGLMLELYVEVDGERVAEYRASATDTWTSFTKQAYVDIYLKKGVHKLRFVWGGIANLSGISITPKSLLAGDMNSDNAIDETDMTLLREMLIGKTETAPKADVNADGKADIRDLVTLANK